MLSNRITLAVAHFYMSGTQNNYYFEQGEVTDIKMSYTSDFVDGARLVTFNNLKELATFIEGSTASTKNVALIEAECHNMGLYLLKSFRLGSMYIQQTADGRFTSTSNSIKPIDLSKYNEYLKFYNSVAGVYTNVYDNIDEYILNQNNYPPTVDPRKYINCGYIQTLFKPYVDELIKLFDEHKNDHKEK